MEPHKPDTDQPDQTRLGIVLTVFGLSVAALTGALMKLSSSDMNAFQITWFRFLGFAVILLPIVLARFGRSVFTLKRPGIHIVRGISLAAATVFFVVGARTINFADAIAILYAYPFLLTVLAVFFLGEQVRLIGWLGVIGGFIGVLLVMQPKFDGFNIGTLFVFTCAVIVSFQMVLNRKLGSISHPLVTSFWGAVVASLVLSAVVPFYWQPISADQLWLLCLIAISGAINQTCIVFGFAKAEASTLAPFTYFEIIAGVVFGFLLFGTLPTSLSWAGIALIAISGIVVARSLGTRLASKRLPKY